MNDLARVHPDLSEGRKYPLVPTLVLLTMTSLTPTASPTNFYAPIAGALRGNGGANATAPGMSYFISNEQKCASNRVPKAGKLAISKGVKLPSSTCNLPDKTIDFLDGLAITPDFINQSQEGSLIVEFNSDNSYHMIEFFPEGDIVFMKQGKAGIEAWDLTADNYFEKITQELSIESDVELV